MVNPTACTSYLIKMIFLLRGSYSSIHVQPHSTGSCAHVGAGGLEPVPDRVSLDVSKFMELDSERESSLWDESRPPSALTQKYRTV